MQAVIDNLNLIITLVLFAVVGVVALWSFIMGLRRGTIRSTTRLLTVVVSAGLALFTVVILSSTLLPTLEPTVKGWVVNLVTKFSADIADAVNSSETLVSYLLELVMTLLTPVVFALVFVGFLLLTYPVFLFLNLFISKKEGISVFSRFCGAGVSLVGAVLVSLCILMPVSGYLSYATEAYPMVMETGLVPEGAVPENVEQQIEAGKNNLAVKTVNVCGGKLLFNMMIKMEDSTATEEINYIIKTTGEAMPAVQQLMEDNADATSSDQMQPLNLTALDEQILPLIDKAPTRIKGVLAEVLRTGAEKWSNDEPFLGIELGSILGEEIASSATVLLEDMAKTEVDTVVRDLETLGKSAEDLSLCLSYFKEITAANPKALVSAGKQQLDLSVVFDKILPLVENSEVEKRFMADVMQNAAEKWKAGETYLDVNMMTMLGNYQSSGDLLLERLIHTDAAHIVEDMNAVCRDMEVLSQTYVYFVDMQGDIKSGEELKSNLTDIVKDMTPETVDVIKESLTEEILNTIDVREGSGAVVEMLGDALGKVTELPETEREKEAEALNQVLNYATGKRTDEATEEAVVDAMLGSSAIGNTIIETVNTNNDPETLEEDKKQITVSAEQKAQMDAAIQNKLDTDPDLTDEQKNVLNALKDLFITESTPDPEA